MVVMPRSLPRAVVLLALVFLCNGCGSGPGVVRVTGTARHDGKPLARLIVHFVPAEGRPSWGMTDEEGHYKLRYDREREGAQTGTHKVWVEFRPAGAKEDLAQREGTLQLPPALQRVLDKYGDKDHPALSVEVKQDNQVIDLPLD
jgi:hypothetical protein